MTSDSWLAVRDFVKKKRNCWKLSANWFLGFDGFVSEQ